MYLLTLWLDQLLKFALRPVAFAHSDHRKPSLACLSPAHTFLFPPFPLWMSVTAVPFRLRAAASLSPSRLLAVAVILVWVAACPATALTCPIGYTRADFTSRSSQWTTWIACPTSTDVLTQASIDVRVLDPAAVNQDNFFVYVNDQAADTSQYDTAISCPASVNQCVRTGFPRQSTLLPHGVRQQPLGMQSVL